MTHAFCALAAEMGIERRMREMQKAIGDFAIQGEVIGPGIQKNKYALTKHCLHAFDVYRIGLADYASPADGMGIVMSMGLAPVPDLGAFALAHSIDEVVAMAEGKSVLNPKIEREGIVLRPETPMKDDRGNRVSFKAINPKFLLKYEE
jgi:RNA ligase (TIGR02306 family)